MSKMNRWGRVAMLAVLAGVMSGCCVLPWGAGGRHGYNGYQEAPRHAQAEQPGPSRGYRGR